MTQSGYVVERKAVSDLSLKGHGARRVGMRAKKKPLRRGRPQAFFGVLRGNRMMGRDDPSRIQILLPHHVFFAATDFIPWQFIVAPLLPLLPRPVTVRVARGTSRGNGSTKARQEQPGFYFGKVLKRLN